MILPGLGTQGISSTSDIGSPGKLEARSASTFISLGHSSPPEIKACKDWGKSLSSCWLGTTFDPNKTPHPAWPDALKLTNLMDKPYWIGS
jgi:hypothetical protein